MFRLAFLCFSLLSLTAHTETPAYGDVRAKWESPTPWLKSRCTDFLDYMPYNAIAVEVGVQNGIFAEYMLNRTNPQTLYLIDCWEQQDPSVYNDIANVPNEQQENSYQETLRKFANDPRVTILRQYSHDAVSRFADESLDWVYLDANHTYEAIKEDLKRWWPKVKKGGILSGHDYFHEPAFGVIQAVNEFLIEYNLYFTYLTTGDYYDSWAIQKPEE
jgi:hypothetical protein